MNNDFLETYELCHHGVIGQKWGIRRYQNPDGSLTPEGQQRYGIKEARRNIYQLGKKMNVSQYNDTFATRDLNRVSFKNTMTRKFGGTVKPEDQKKYDIQKQIASKMAADYKRDKKAYVDAVKEARKQYGNQNIKDIKRSITGEPIMYTSFENFCNILGGGLGTAGAIYYGFGPQTAHNKIPSAMVYGAGLAIKNTPNMMYKAQYKNAKQKMTYELTGQEQPKKLAAVAKEKWASLDKKQKAAIIAGGAAVAGILGAGAIGISNANRDPNVVDVEWHEVIDALPLR